MKRKANKEKMKICLVGSSGGHLTHLYMLKPFWKDKDRFWVTFDKHAWNQIADKKLLIEYVYLLTHGASHIRLWIFRSGL